MASHYKQIIYSLKQEKLTKNSNRIETTTTTITISVAVSRCEPLLASSLSVFFFHLLRKRTSRNKWHRFILPARRHCHHTTNSVKALMQWREHKAPSQTNGLASSLLYSTLDFCAGFLSYIKHWLHFRNQSTLDHKRSTCEHLRHSRRHTELTFRTFSSVPTRLRYSAHDKSTRRSSLTINILTDWLS